MKRFYVALLCVVALSSCGVQECRVEGEIANYQGPEMLYLVDVWNKGADIDSVKIVNNKFDFKGVESEPTMAYLTTKEGPAICYLFIEPGKVVISGDMLNRDVLATGTTSNDAMAAIEARKKQLVEEFNEAVQQKDKEKMESIRESYDAVQTEAAEANKDNLAGLFLLEQSLSSMSATAMAEKLETLPEHIKANHHFVTLQEMVAQKRKSEPYVEGSDFIPYYMDIVLNDAEGKSVSLKSVVENKANRYVLIDFWASWCGPCMREIPYLVDAYAKYHKRGFEIYGASFDRTKEAWVKAMKEKKMKWVNVSFVDSDNDEAATNYSVQTIPTNFLIDCSTGIIIDKDLRGEEVEKRLAELFK